MRRAVGGKQQQQTAERAAKWSGHHSRTPCRRIHSQRSFLTVLPPGPARRILLFPCIRRCFSDLLPSPSVHLHLFYSLSHACASSAPLHPHATLSGPAGAVSTMRLASLEPSLTELLLGRLTSDQWSEAVRRRPIPLFVHAHASDQIQCCRHV